MTNVAMLAHHGTDVPHLYTTGLACADCDTASDILLRWVGSVV